MLCNQIPEIIVKRKSNPEIIIFDIILLFKCLILYNLFVLLIFFFINFNNLIGFGLSPDVICTPGEDHQEQRDNSKEKAVGEQIRVVQVEEIHQDD